MRAVSKKWLWLMASILLSVQALAAEFNPAVVYDKVGKYDRSFNEAVFRNGVEKFAIDYGVEVFELEPQYRTARDKGIMRLAKIGYSPIVTVGFSFSGIVTEAAKAYPGTQFVVIDAVIDLPNVKSVVFAEHEGSFLMGVLGAMASKSNSIGFVGGMDIPLISKFGCGYAQGAKYVNKDTTVFRVMTGNTPAAFRNPEKGGKLAFKQIGEGADVIFSAAGATGVGVFSAAEHEGILAIGVDSNQNWIRPGTILTSMVKHVGFAAFQAWEEAMNDEWQPGIVVLGLKEGGVDWALDKYNRPLISEQMEAMANSVKKDIIDGKILVHDYTTDNSCPI